MCIGADGMHNTPIRIPHQHRRAGGVVVVVVAVVVMVGGGQLLLQGRTATLDACMCIGADGMHNTPIRIPHQHRRAGGVVVVVVAVVVMVGGGVVI